MRETKQPTDANGTAVCEPSVVVLGIRHTTTALSIVVSTGEDTDIAPTDLLQVLHDEFFDMFAEFIEWSQIRAAACAAACASWRPHAFHGG